MHGRNAPAAVLALLALAACADARREDGRHAVGGAPGLHADFTAEGAIISPTGGAGPAFRATPWGLGCDGALAPLGDAAPETRGDRTVYARPELDEWYVPGPVTMGGDPPNPPRGVEQGFTLRAPPPCRRAGGTGVVIALGGGLPVVVDEGGRGARLQDAAGREVLRYADLHVVDAAGRELPSSIEARGEGLTIRFDDTGAAYPVVVDPSMWAVKQEIPEPDAGAGDNAFGASVAVSGDTLLVGAPGQTPPSAGAAYAFVRSGTGWNLQQALGAGDGTSGAAFGIAVALQGDTAVAGALQQGAARRARPTSSPAPAPRGRRPRSSALAARTSGTSASRRRSTGTRSSWARGARRASSSSQAAPGPFSRRSPTTPQGTDSARPSP